VSVVPVVTLVSVVADVSEVDDVSVVLLGHANKNSERVSIAGIETAFFIALPSSNRILERRATAVPETKNAPPKRGVQS